MTMYTARYNLGGNVNKIATKDSIKFSHSDLNM